MVLNQEWEFKPRDEIAGLQLARLKAIVSHVSRNVPFYRDNLAAAGIGPESITSLDDLSRLPFTVKQDLRDYYPFGLFAVPMDRVARIHASSGTTGKMTVVGYTLKDIDTWAQLMARTLACPAVRSIPMPSDSSQPAPRPWKTSSREWETG